MENKVLKLGGERSTQDVYATEYLCHGYQQVI